MRMASKGSSRMAALVATVVLAVGVAAGGAGTAGADPLGSLGSLGDALGSSGQTTPPFSDGPFYEADPQVLAGLAPGDVIDTRAMPDLAFFPGVSISQVSYRSTNSAGEPIVATTTIMKPRGAVDGGPLLSYQHIMNALGPGCRIAPALYSTDPETIVREAPALNVLLMRGWTVALPDHLGPTMAYGAAKLGGQVTLDGIRAAQRAGIGLETSPVGLLGYSGGGMATSWAAALAPEYAPELEIAGVASGGVPMDLEAMLEGLGSGSHPAFGLAMAAAMGLEREYPERFPVSSVLNDEGHRLADQISDGCTNRIMASGVGKSVAQIAVDPGFLDTPAARGVFAENSLVNYPGVPNMPLFSWHSATDPLIPVPAIDSTLARYCAEGATVQKHNVLAPEHMIAAVEGVGPAVAYLQDRFDGKPAPSNCDGGGGGVGSSGSLGS